jgi:xanthine/CO dehydrogenase XdhC/CoxF family maturation factor
VEDVRTEFLLYGAVIVVFGGVVLWATDAPAEIVVGSAIAAGVLLLGLAVLVDGRRRMLVVGETDEGHPLATAFEAAGYEVWECAGPENGPCPVDAGKPCPMHDRPGAAVIVRHEGGIRALAPCGKALHVPALAVEEGSDLEPEFAGRYARIGAERGTEAVVEMADRLAS